MSLAFFSPQTDDAMSDRDRLGPDISAWTEQHHSARKAEVSEVERDRMLIALFGAVNVLHTLIGAEAMAALLHGEYAAAVHRIARDRQMARRS